MSFTAISNFCSCSIWPYHSNGKKPARFYSVIMHQFLITKCLKENEILIFSAIVLIKRLNNDYSGTEIMLAQRLQAKPEPHEDPLLCGRLLQQEAAIFSQSPSTPPGCDVGYGEREFQRQLSASRLLLCFFWSCVSKFNGTLYSPLSMPYVTTLQYQEIFWQNGSLLYGLDTAKQEFFMRLQLRLQSLHKHDFISNQLLFYSGILFKKVGNYRWTGGLGAEPPAGSRGSALKGAKPPWS